MPPRPPQPPSARFLRRTSGAVLRLVPIMAAVSMALWPEQSPTLVFGLLGLCVALCALDMLARRTGRGTPA